MAQNDHRELNALNTPILKAFCDQMPGGYFIYKAEGNEELLYANNDVYDLFGCMNEKEFRELTGNTFRGMVYPEDYPEVSESIVKQIRESAKKRDYVEYRITRKDGKVLWVNDYGHYVDTEEYGGVYYVFISDITKDHYEQEKADSIRETVIKTLTHFYHTVWVIDDIETEHWSLYYADADDVAEHTQDVKSLLSDTPYSVARIPLVENIVAEEDRERVREELSLSSIVERLNHDDRFSILFLRKYSDGTPNRYFRIDIGKLELPENRMGVTMGFKDVDKEFRAVRNEERAMLEAEQAREENKRLIQRYDAIKGLADLVDSATSMVSTVPNLSFSKNADGVYIACNQAFAEYAGKTSPEEVVGLTDHDLFDPETADKFVADDVIARSMDRPYVFYENVMSGDGTGVARLQTTKVRFFDRQGRPCVMGLCVDLTELTRIKTIEAAGIARKQEMEERLTLREQLLEEKDRREKLDKMLTALSADYRSVYYVDLDNDEAVCFRSDPIAVDQHSEGEHFAFLENFTGYAEKYVDRSYREGFKLFINPENIREMLSWETTINFRYLLRREGQEYYERISFASIDNESSGDGIAVHKVVLGLTNVDTEMRDSIAKNEALAQALTAAEEANKAKTAFLSNMSHEIRTPMNAIIGLDSLALQDETVQPKTRGYMEQIKDSAHHLMTLINDILDMSRIESGKFILRNEEFSLRRMLEQINTLVMSQCAEKGLRYECKVRSGVSDYYIGDDMKLKQVLINILSNAIKFTEAPGRVTLTVERTALFEDKSTLKFSVKDTGIGINPDFIPKIFDSFTQENSDKKNKYGSTGLGMAITKNIVEMMNGTISVTSEKGVGSEFTVVMTLTNSNHRGLPAGYIKPKDIRVLVIDNDQIAAEHARLILGELGIYVDTCHNGKDALRMMRVQYVKHAPYNLVLVDRMLRGMDGMETTKKIRKLYKKDTTVVIMTTFNMDEFTKKALACGVDGFLTKPLIAANVVNEFERIARKNKIGLIKENRHVELKGKRILMAEDVFINAEIVKQLMFQKEVEVDHAENGRIAVEMFAASKPDYYDAILMDVRMPEMDGLEATEAIRALDRPDAQRVPIIAMTANAFDEDVQNSLQVGMNAHLSKPVEPTHLYSTLEEMIWAAEQE